MSKRLVSIITANSNSGSACLEELLAKYSNNVNVRAVFRTDEKAKPFVQKYPNLEVVTGVDASTPETLAKAFLGAKTALIIHPLDATSWDLSRDSQLSVNMINAAAENGVTHIVYVGSCSVLHHDEVSLIASRFVASEELLKQLSEQKGIKFTILRPGAFMENYQHQFATIKADSSFSYPDIQHAPLYTKDIGKAAAVVIGPSNPEKHYGKYYELHGGETFNSNDLARMYSEALGRKIKWNEQKDFSKLPPAMSQVFNSAVKHGGVVPMKENHLPELIGKPRTFKDFLNDHLDELKN